MTAWKFAPILGILLLAASGARAGDGPATLEELEFPMSYWVPPRAREYRRALPRDGSLLLAPSRYALRLRLEALVPLAPDEVHAGRLLGRMIATLGGKAQNARSFQDTLDALGARLGTRMEQGHLLIWISASAPGFPKAADLFFTALREPALDARALEGIKSDELDRWNRRGAEARTQEEVLYLHLAGAAAGPPASSTFEAVTEPALLELHRRRFGLPAVVFALSGPFDEAALVPTLAKPLESWPAAAPPAARPAAPAGKGIHVLPADTALVRGLFGFPRVPDAAPDEPAFRVAFQILSARFVKRAQPLGREPLPLDLEPIRDCAGRVRHVFRILARPSEAGGAIRLLAEEADRLAAEAPDAPTLLEAVDALKRSWATEYAGAARKVRTLALDAAQRGGLDEKTELYGGILAVSREHVREAAARYLQPGALLAVLSGPPDKIEEEAQYAGLKAKGLGTTRALAFSTADR